MKANLLIQENISINKKDNDNVNSQFDLSHLNEHTLSDINSKNDYLTVQCALHLALSTENSFCTVCGQVFCDDCLKKFGSNTCYVCKTSKKDLMVKVMPVYKQILRSLKFFCPMQNKGCTELVTVESIFYHAKVCKHSVTECSTCKQQVRTEEMQSHNCVEYLFHRNSVTQIYKMFMTFSVQIYIKS